MSAEAAITKEIAHPDKFRVENSKLILSSLLIGTLSLSLPVLTLQVYDRILPNPNSGTLPVLATGVCIAVMMDIALRLCRGYMLGWTGAAYDHDLSCDAIKHILNADLNALRKDGIGENLNRLTAISKLREFHNGYDLVTYTDLLFVLPYLSLIAYIGGLLVIVPIVVMTVFAIFMLAIGKWLNRSLAGRDKADDRRYDFLIEGLSGIHTIKAFSLEKPFLRRYEALQYDATIANYDVTESTATMFNTATIFSHLMMACVITVGAWRTLDGDMTSGALIASIFLSGRIMQPVQRALGLWTRYQDYKVAEEKVGELFAFPTTVRLTPVAKEPERTGSLVLENVSFGNLFKNVSLTMRPGEVVLINGPYGVGKSTLLKIMSGLYKPDEGRVLVDGVDPLAYRPDTLMSHIGLVNTEGSIFRGRIRDNLTRFGSIPEKKVQPIATALGIELDVSRLPRGFDTWMDGSEQDSVPPGLRQRIAVGRVLAAHPKIFLFDNAEHNLDREGYRQIHALMGRLKGQMTMVIVAGDNNIASLADRRFVLTPHGLEPEAAPYGDNDTIIPFTREKRT